MIRLTALLFLAPFLAHSAVWDGTANTDWYSSSKTEFIITTAEQLAGLAKLVNAGNSFENKTVIQGADIQLNDTAGWTTWNSNTVGLKQWIPIGTEKQKFGGVFDGGEYKISGLYISTNRDYQGLFGYIEHNVSDTSDSNKYQIGDIRVIAGFVKGGNFTGFLAGHIRYKEYYYHYYDNPPTIGNSYVTGNVSGGSSVGGLVGENGGKIIGSHSSGKVSGRSNIGGLVGVNFGKIRNSHGAGNVNGSTNVGGLVGQNAVGYIYGCHASGKVRGDSIVGGLLGVNAGVSDPGGGESYLRNSYAFGDVNGINEVGGLAGVNAAIIEDSYVTGNVIGKGNHVDGLVGWNVKPTEEEMKDDDERCEKYGECESGYPSGRISNSYSSGIVSK